MWNVDHEGETAWVAAHHMRVEGKDQKLERKSRSQLRWSTAHQCTQRTELKVSNRTTKLTWLAQRRAKQQRR